MDLEECSDKISWAFEDDADEDQRLPIWVRNLRKSIDKSCLPKAISLKDASSDDVSALGLAEGIGQQAQHILREKLPLFAELLGMPYTEADEDELEAEFDKLKHLKERAEKKLGDSSLQEKKAYHTSFADGLAPLLDEQGQPKGAKTNTMLEFLMILNWPVIEKNCRTRRQLYELLQPMCANFKIELGGYERVEKMLERIEFSPANPGRPKK